MGKKKQRQTSGLGHAVIKDRFRGKRSTDGGDRSVAHTSELDDGYDWGRIGGISITEQNALDEFLETAALAGTEFTAEKLNVQVVTEFENEALPSFDKRIAGEAARKEHRKRLRIPRRPAWTKDTTAEELQANERTEFLEWRRGLAELQENTDLLLTPFERNLDFWRQLWRVIERSDVVVQIVDARNPLLFRCRDLEGYVKEVSESKANLLLINKADLLSDAQRAQWAEYFTNQGTPFVFFSAKLEAAKQEAIEAAQQQVEEEVDEYSDLTRQSLQDLEAVTSNWSSKKGGFAALAIDDEDEEENDDEDHEDQHEDGGVAGSDDDNDDVDDINDNDNGQEQLASAESIVASNEPRTSSSTPSPTEAGELTATRPDHDEPAQPATDIPEIDAQATSDPIAEAPLSGAAYTNFFTADDAEELALGAKEDNAHVWDVLAQHHGQLFDVEMLVELLVSLGNKEDGIKPTIGLVGYPNVGKSSSINAICKTKKVSVSATPGKTKHFQTILLDDLDLCDCPGLVFPNFAKTRAELVCNGILPVDQLRDTIVPTTHVCHTIPRTVLESTYGIRIIKPAEGEDPNRPPTAFELLNAYSFARGFMNQRGLPDVQRGGRIVLKDYVNGKLLFVKPPPGYPQLSSLVPTEDDISKAALDTDTAYVSGPRHNPTYVNTVDEQFFRQKDVKAITRGANGSEAQRIAQGRKPMQKGSKKHFKKNKKEKTRRLVGSQQPYA
eukprot:TRINITY_DN4633_c0_g1_i1.p1 TRINITY_DN4633_c0_g1~~TRINITY_DN4633_c0_g1_i1.p1  ORF type:complete len:726 (+),score=195.53 TRINITY_DN4633_c0_g1_i1:22-2199(+)